MNLFDAFRIPAMTETDRFLFEIHQAALQSNLDIIEMYCNETIAKCNLMENRKNIREAMTTDERLDVVNTRMKMEMFLTEIRTLR